MKIRDSVGSEWSVFLVDDDDGVRAALVRAFRLEGLHVEAFSSAEAFLAAYRPDFCGCLLLDVRMPGMDGMELQAELAVRGSGLPVIIMTGAADVDMAVQAMKAGAMDFVQKPVDTLLLLALVHAAFEQNARRRRTADAHHLAAQRLALLTGRESEVCGLVAQGKSCKAIAHELGISFRTVEKHRTRIFSKLGAGSLVELAQMHASATAAVASRPAAPPAPPRPAAGPRLAAECNAEDCSGILVGGE